MKFTPKENRRIYNAVKNYNRRVQSAYNSGNIYKRDLPELARVYNIKHNYSTKKEALQEVKNLEAFTRLSGVQSKAGFVSDYERYLIDANKESARKFFRHQYNHLKKIAQPYRLDQQNRLELYKYHYEQLGRNTDSMTEAELKRLAGAIDDYRLFHNKQGAGYRGFLEEIDVVMRNRRIPESKRNEYFNKLNQLTPQEFYDLYTESDVVERLYDLLDSPDYKELNLPATEITLNEPDPQKVDDMLQSLDEQLDAFLAKKNKK